MRFSYRIGPIVLTLILLLLPCASAAQHTGTGRLTGAVKDAQGMVFPGAEIVVVNEETRAAFRVFADREGAWTIERVPPGAYTITITAASAAPVVLTGIKVEAGGAATADATLLPGISETVIVTASRTEQLLVNAPAAVTIIGDRRLVSEPTPNYADVMREVPGVNVVQMSARDFNVTPRIAANTPAAGQLVIVDGRPINQDYYGYVAWDFVPTGLNEVKQVEVLRGAA